MLKNPQKVAPRDPPKRDPKVAFKNTDARIKPLPGVQIRPDIEIEPNTDGWLTRLQSSQLLKVSVTTIINYERAGKLRKGRAYREDPRGISLLVNVYDPMELTALQRFASAQRITSAQREILESPGEVAARCYELLDEGKTANQIVIALRKTPDQVRELHEKWLDGGGSSLTITPVAKEAIERAIGATFADVTELVTLIETLAGKSSAQP